jgi:drug/metabolite transporter (DMT)-like permease
MPIRPELKGVALMLLGIFFITSNDAVTKILAERYPLGEVICLRQLASMLFIVPLVLATSGIASLRVVDYSGQAIRAVAFFATAALMIASLAYLPLAIATAIAFSSPLFIAALAGPFLGENVTQRRVLAILAGFAGVLIVIRPGSPSFTSVLLFPVAMALANAIRDMMTRKLARTETSVSILFWSMLLSLLISALSIPFGWVAIAPIDIGWLVLGGLLNALAHFTMIAAYRFADTSALAPYRYSSLVWAIIFGWAIWGHLPDWISLLGALVIVAAAVAAVDRPVPKPDAKPAL